MLEDESGLKISTYTGGLGEEPQALKHLEAS